MNEKCQVEGCMHDACCVVQFDSGQRLNVCAECLVPSPAAQGETDLEELERLYGNGQKGKRRE